MNGSASSAWSRDLPEATLDPSRLEEISQLESFRPGLVTRLVDLFRDVLRSHLPTCSDLENADDEAIKASAHAIKGAAASVGAARLALAAGACEKCPADAADESPRAALSAEADRAVAALDHWSANLYASQDNH